jgi:ATP-binding cassette, subfamily B, bacterial
MRDIMEQFKFIWQKLQSNRLKMVAMIFSVIIYVSLILLSPLFFSFFVDNVIGDRPVLNPAVRLFSDLLGGVGNLRDNLWIGGVIIIVISAFTGVAMYWRGRLNGEISENVTLKIRDEVYRHLQRLPYSYHVNAKTGDLIQRCTSDVDQIRRFLAAQISELAYAIVLSLIAGVILFSIHVPLAWLSIVSLPIIFAFAYIFFIKMQKAFKASDESEGEMSAVIQENLSGTRVVKAFNRESYELDKFEKKNRKFRDLTYRLIHLLGMYWGISDLICLLQILLVVVSGIMMAKDGSITVGNYFVFVSYVSMILWPVRNVGRILSDMGKVGVSVDRLKEILNHPLEDIDNGLMPDINGSIVFDHVYFKYDDGEEDVLRNVSFDVKKGETIAIMGPTGSGKSSLVHLLTRLHDYREGSITIDGVELREIKRSHLRKHVGIVLQEPFLFSKTISANIALAMPQAPEEEIERAAKIASVHQVITEFDRGYQTLVGEKGVTLSGGQKQRIAIARTIINNSPILIFDDSLSAVDTETDMHIRSALGAIAKDTTTIIITHRISSAQNADNIIVLNEGRIEQQGTHAQLLAQEGLYKRIADIQSAMVMGGEDDE